MDMVSYLMGANAKGGGGGSSDVFRVNITWDEGYINGTADKTTGEIITAAQAGKVVMMIQDYFDEQGVIAMDYLLGVEYSDNTSWKYIFNCNNLSLEASNLDDYPTTPK